mmetsp:Transcript_4310/g.10602  ORF Transcript_4310/g.10602 Transcript_4310/m.10602 type:complete len:872 (+) Transcript_4310:217-2832(+)
MTCCDDDQQAKCAHVAGFGQRLLQKGFYHYGELCHRFPHWLMLFAFAVCGLLAIGLINIEEETSSNRLWVPQDSRALRDQAIFESYYGDDWETLAVIQVPLDEATGVLTKPVLMEVLDFYDATLAVVSEVGGRNYTYETLCYLQCEDCGICRTFSLLALWNFSSELLLSDPDILLTVNLNLLELDMPSILGSPEYDAQGNIVYAAAIQSTFFLNDSLSDDGREQWQRDWMDMTREQFDFVLTSAYPISEQALSDMFQDNLTADLPLLMVSGILVITFMILALGYLHLIHGAVLMSLAGLVNIAMGVCVGYSVGAAAGYPIGPINQFVPFVLLGIGVDDLFILYNQFEFTKGPSIKGRMAMALSKSGVSITVTTISDFAVFLLGLISELPAVQSFAVYSSVAVLADFFFQLTFWYPLMGLDARRREASRLDCVPCFKVEQNEDRCCCLKPITQDDESHSERACGFIHKFLFSIPAKIIILLAAATLIGLAIWGCTQITREFDENEFIPSSSFLKDYVRKSEEYFAEDTFTITFWGVTEQIDYFRSRDEMLTLINNTVAVPQVDRLVYGWLPSFIEWLPLNAPPGTLAPNGWPISEPDFYTLLHSFLDSIDGQRFQVDIIFASNATATDVIVQARSQFTSVNAAQDQDEIDLLHNLYAVSDASPLANYVYSGAFPFTTSIDNILREVILSVLISLGIMLVVLLLFLVHPLMVLMCFLCVICTVLVMVGSFPMWGLTINVVSFIMLFISVGISLDFSAHMSHAYIASAAETRQERVLEIMKTTSLSVCSGGISTILAIVALAFAISWPLKVFFQLLFTTTVAALFFGVLVLPVFLSVIGPLPKWHFHEFKSKSTAALSANMDASNSSSDDDDKL